ncbi:transcriptional regulator [Mucor ambiguus]|uniref:Transcriptional regulator n=1 Tax=Mucor ambiguus TaxID=91626 RepID=A0A0C9MM21_9FUNG|nr:transcriptional regulator [Mucor ambiguus]
MVVHRRGGRPSGGGRRKQRAPARRRSQSTSDENSSDGGSITRCVCGETHSVGLMVQCDKCEVWQHCECMGLEQPDIPDHYYCEQCKPENHKSLRQHNGRTKRQYVATERAAAIVKAPKKRMTLNSREASMSLEDVLAARSALEMYESHKDGDSPHSDSPPPIHANVSDDPPPAHQDTDMEATTTATSPPNESSMAVKESGDTATLVKSTKRKRDFGIKLPDTIDEKSEPPSSTVSSVGHDELPSLKEQEEFSEPDRITPKPSTSSLAKPKRKQVKPSEKKVNGRVNGKSTTSKRGKPRSRTSTPVRESSPMACSELDDDTGKESPEDGISSVLFDHFSPAARASSPPAKTRQPHARMSISEMNRRSNQILEYISSIQVEMASKETYNRAGHGNSMKSNELSVAVTMQQHHDGPMRDDDDDNDSLSSASTIPLNRDAEEEDLLEPLDKDKQSSMEIMDMLTRKLIRFQQRFGSRGRTLYEEALMEGEGRITRSREASGSVNTTYRNMVAH